MADLEIIHSLKTAAAASIDRGFAILAVEPHAKDPWPKYSPHAVHSATRDKEIAFKPWDDGHEANYGVAGGASNLTIIDVDKGIPNYEALRSWMEAKGLPDTFIVKSGRKSSFGAHLYYSNAVPTTPYDIDGVVGELRGVGAYVVGPGSIHPEGDRYEIINDIPVAPLPDHLVLMAATKKKQMADFKPGQGKLVPTGNRWAHLQRKAGQLKELGITTEEGIYAALKAFCDHHCEDGENYPDDKVRNLAEWAASDECEASETVGIVTVGSPDPEADENIPEMPLSTIEGDYVGDLALAMTNGTFIPPSFAKSDLKTVMGAILDGHVGFPGEETLHMRHWTAIVSTRPETGKSEVWKRCMMLLQTLLKNHDVKFPPAGYISSGEHAIKTLAEADNKSHLLYFDEMKNLFEKGNHVGSTLFTKLLELYEQKAGAAGSLTHNQASFSNVSLSMVGNFTRAGFDRSVAGKGAGGDGFLSRMVFDFSNGQTYQGDWEAMDSAKINSALSGITAAIQWILNWQGENNGIPFVPKELDDAKTTRQQFQKWLAGEKIRIQQESPDAGYFSRIEAHFKRDLLLRAIFTPFTINEVPVITKDMVERSWAWAKHQLMLREELWPIDQGGPIEKCEKRIIKAIEKKGPLTKSGVQKFSNAANSEGGFDAWNRAWMNLLKAERVVLMPVKSDKGREKFGLIDAIWSKSKNKWLHGNPNA